MRIKLTFTAAQAIAVSTDLTAAIEKVIFTLKRNVRKYARSEEWDMVKTYAGDLADWIEIRKALVTNPRRARQIYSNMDTASREYLHEYGGITSKSGEVCKEAEKIFNIQIS